jgi:hypothetical protein
MLGKRALDPRKGFIVERLRKIDPEYAAIEATLQPGARLL